MTIPRERTQSLINTREFLRSLLDPKLTPKVPKDIRRQAYQHLKHFPANYHLSEVSEVCSNIFGTPVLPACISCELRPGNFTGDTCYSCWMKVSKK